MSRLHTSRIHAYSRLIRIGVILLVFPILVGVGYFFYTVIVAPELLVEWVQRNVVEPGVPVRITPAVVLVLAVLGAINLTLMGNGLLAIWRLCGYLDRGTVFAPAVGACLREAGFYALACAVCQFISNILAVIAVTINNPEGQQQLAISFSSDMAFLVVISGLLMVMGHIMVIASEIDAENREFI